ncbi:MAG: hypothetical protein WBA62_03780 [Xanthobacteraceae bacterium]
MSLSSLSDESILRYHANMRSMVALDIGADGCTLLGEQAKKRGRDLENELRRRGISFDPIGWPE